MKKIVPLAEYLKEYPEFKTGWKVRFDESGNFKAYYHPKYGKISSVVVFRHDRKGNLIIHDQPMIEELKTGVVICPYFKNEEGVFIGIVKVDRPLSDEEYSLELPRCFGEPGKEALDSVQVYLKGEIDAEIVRAFDGGKVLTNSTFYRTPTQLILAEVNPTKGTENKFWSFYKYPEETDGLKKENKIKCAFSLAVLSIFETFAREGKI